MKENKGVTLVAVIITVLILLIITGASVTIGVSTSKNVKMKEVSTNLLLIKAKVQTIAEKHNFDSSEQLVGKKIESSNLSEEINNIVSEGVLTSETISSDEIYLLGQDDLNSFGLNDLNANDGYLVDYTNNEVIYLKGVKNSNNEVVYKLSDMM